MKTLPASAFIAWACALSGCASAAPSGSTAAAAPTQASACARLGIADKVKDLQSMPGLFPLHWDQKTGKLWLEIPRLDDDLLYVASLPAGIGSNDTGSRTRLKS